MDFGERSGHGHWPWWQLAITAATGAAIVMMPPAQGTILLVPTVFARMGPSTLIRDDVRLLGQGRLPGSLVVDASRTRLAAEALANGILPISASAPLCGSIK